MCHNSCTVSKLTYMYILKFKYRTSYIQPISFGLLQVCDKWNLYGRKNNKNRNYGTVGAHTVAVKTSVVYPDSLYMNTDNEIFPNLDPDPGP